METSPTIFLELVIIGIFSILLEMRSDLQLARIEFRSQFRESKPSPT
jgi:hypothetical protein